MLTQGYILESYRQRRRQQKRDGTVAAVVVRMQLGATHLALLTDEGQLYTFGSGTALCLHRKARTSWELTEITEPSLDGRKVLDVACGPHTTALIVEA